MLEISVKCIFASFPNNCNVIIKFLLIFLRFFLQSFGGLNFYFSQKLAAVLLLPFIYYTFLCYVAARLEHVCNRKRRGKSFFLFASRIFSSLANDVGSYYIYRVGWIKMKVSLGKISRLHVHDDDEGPHGGW